MNIDDFIQFKESKAWRFASRDHDYKIATFDCTIHQSDIYQTLLSHDPGMARNGGTTPAFHFVSVLKSLPLDIRNMMLKDYLYANNMIARDNLINNNVVIQDYHSSAGNHNHGVYVKYTYTYCRVLDSTAGLNRVTTPTRDIVLQDRTWIKFDHLENHNSFCATPCIFYVFNTRNTCDNIELLL